MSRFFLGVSMGQGREYSALSILELQTDGDSSLFRCLHLERWPLRASYPQVVSDVARMIRTPELLAHKDKPVLAIDTTGAGAPVYALFKKECAREVDLLSINITGAGSVTRDGDLSMIPKRDLVSCAQIALQSGLLKIAPALPEGRALMNELMNFQIAAHFDAGGDVYGAWREGVNDGLVLALSTALWVGSNGTGKKKLVGA